MDITQILIKLKQDKTEFLHYLRACLPAEQWRIGQIFTQVYQDDAENAAKDAQLRAEREVPQHPLAGLPVSVKDLLDVAGTPTWAGSPTRKNAAPALHDAPVVARLRRTGAAIVGKTNMTELAFSGVGINPHTGTPANPVTRALGVSTLRIPGGSSSGAAVSVASGMCVAALGSDTGGSIRIPAALCGLVGFKPTQARVGNQGSIPLAPSFDTLCAITRSVRDAALLDAVISDASVNTHTPILALHAAPPQSIRLLLPESFVLEGMEEGVAHAFDAALVKLSRAGVTLVRQPLKLLDTISQRNPAPGISAAEAYALHGAAAESTHSGMDEWVRKRILLGASVDAEQLQALYAARRDWIAQMHAAYFSTPAAQGGFDALVMPTTVISAPPIAALEQSEDAFFRTNALLLRNTFIANYLDGCAITLPCQAPDQAPVGLMLIAPAYRDAQLLQIALMAEGALLDG